MVQSPADSRPGAKEQFLGDFLVYIRSTWGIRAIFTLTDKDWAEINAFLRAHPEAKHQLCFWHALRALKQRLAILRRRPAHYDVDKARSEFSWIDPTFVPVAQSQEPSPVCFLFAGILTCTD